MLFSTLPLSIIALLSATTSLTSARSIIKARTNEPLSAGVINVAGGDIPTAGLPPTISPGAINDFMVANFLENLEAFFFASGAQNLSSWGASAGDVGIVERVAAQEQVHVATIEALLTNFKAQVVTPCQYTFPSSVSKDTFLSLAQIITSVGIGAVIDVLSGISATDPALIPSVSSIVTVESRHDAYFRVEALGAVPNPTPFDTRISGIWALNLASPFVVPGSCAWQPEFPTFAPLTILSPLTKFTGSGGDLTLSVDVTKISPPLAPGQKLWIGWVNQANNVVYEEVDLGAGASGVVQFTSTIPDGLNGIAFAALTGQNTALDVTALTAATLAGPVPVQIS
ncbi:hypothetical protein MMC09_004856 [Bachmanniomyces sp. S44760]|nr:hypothetical protein [Bachmanniomyces sp. S44760]